jgi:hypothetical protein
LIQGADEGMGLMMVRVWLALFCCSAGARAQYVGAQVCGSCHTERMKQQADSEHARALRRPGEHALAQRFPAGFAFDVVAGQEKKRVVIEWAFGAGDQAVTFVSHLDEDTYLENRFSYYTRAGGLDLTPGHPAKPKTKWPDAAGVVYKTFDPDAAILRCFQCHSTGPLSVGGHMEIVPAELGVRCEACHGPGQSHVDAARAGNLAAARSAIQNPGRLPAAAQIQICGDCHRKPQQGETATNWNDAWNTRHQPLYLAQSACFRKSNGALTCIRCHDPHGSLRQNDAPFYNAKCAGCHSGKPHPQLAGGRAADNCIACHMPEVSPRQHLQFANHWIGVYAESSPLKPVR